MQKAWSNFAWENLPSTNTALEADRLNTMNSALETIDNRVVTYDTSKANQTDLLQAVKSISFDDTTGTFRFTFFNDTYIDINTDIEKIAVNFDYDDDPTSAHYQNLIITLDDGTVKYVDLSALITEYEFNSTSTIQVTVALDGSVSFDVKNGSITANKLEPNYLANIQIEVGKAETASSNSEAWAVGQRGGSDVPSTDETYHNNSKYYAGLADDRATDAEQAKQDAEDAVDEIYTALNMVQFTVDFTTGELMYTDDTAYIFTVNETTGNLEWEVQSV